VTPDLKQLQELLAKPHVKPHGRDSGCWCDRCYEAECHRIYLANILIAQAPALLASHEALSAEVAGLREDKARLDWLDKSRPTGAVIVEWQCGDGRLPASPEVTLRAAIDAARQEKKDA
jgi:hypothetical protein